MSTDSQHSRFVCTDCGKSYKAVETLNRHRKNHIQGIEYSCNECHACFKRKDLLDRHSLIHANERPILNTCRSGKACDRCSRLKTKCDGQSTCARCQRGGHCCTYKSPRTRAGRSSAGTLSPLRSPRPSISETGSPENLGYSMSDPNYPLSDSGDSVTSDQCWNTSDTWVQGLDFAQDTNWSWPATDSIASGFPGLGPPYLDPSQPLQHSNPAMWNDLSPNDLSECSQVPPGSLNDVDYAFGTSATMLWPQYGIPEAAIDPALVGDFSFSMQEFEMMGMQCPYVQA